MIQYRFIAIKINSLANKCTFPGKDQCSFQGAFTVANHGQHLRGSYIWRLHAVPLDNGSINLTHNYRRTATKGS